MKQKREGGATGSPVNSISTDCPFFIKIPKDRPSTEYIGKYPQLWAGNIDPVATSLNRILTSEPNKSDDTTKTPLLL
ncbi:hypothetical protein [Desulfobacter latus]|uniref:Uncharacterized protein n=1 Tax=Desulfobacter latus TaxID=2292 RepID=A0A850SXG7_9BACT|nr:hypothetical protein [Desulfobacter latus]NWH04840.1 hypothetical protein [Desulfobacter latus]